jgi:hypothetical protein
MLSEQKSGIVVSESNSFSGALGAGAIFTGTAEDIRQYSETTVNVYGTPSVAAGTLYFEYSPDGLNWDVSVPYTLDGPQSFVPLPLRTVLPFFRVRYENGLTPLLSFRLTVVYHWSSAKQITRVINQVIDENEPVENVRAFIGGKSPDGPFTNLPSSGGASAQSTNTPLGIAGTFLGSEIQSTTGYLASAISIISNVNGATDGLKFNWYADLAGLRPLGVTSFTYGSAPLATAVQVPIKGPYFRISYLNGAIAQATFELVTTLLVTAPPPDVLPISSTITGNNAASIVKASIVGLQENGIYSNSKLSNSSSQMVAIADRPSEVRNRTRVIIPVNRTTVALAGTVLYTVTATKTLYISNFFFTQLNDSAAIGEWRLRDSVTVKSGFILSSRAGGTPAAASSAAPTLPEPLNFTTNVNAVLITGTIEIAGFLLGYEE